MILKWLLPGTKGNGRGLVLKSWIVWKNPYKILLIIHRCTKYDIRAFEVAPYGSSLSQYFSFPGSDKIIFHIDEAMSWECVRDLNRMYPLINLIHNLANQHEAPESIIECIIEVRRNFEEARTAFIKGETE